MKTVKPQRWKPSLRGKTSSEAYTGSFFAIGGLLLVTLLMFLPVWTGHASLFANDIVNLNLPQRHLLGEIWRTGEVPLWNPYSFGGQPLLAAMQSGVLYPLNSLFLFLPDWLALHISYILHYWLAGVFLYLYLRALMQDHLTAWLSGVIFMTSGFLTGHLIHTQMLNAAVWVPLVLFFLEKLRQTGRTRYAVGVSLTLTVQWLAGHPQISFYTYLAAGLYLLFFAWQERTAWKRTIAQGGLALLVGTALAAVQLMPTWELIRHSVREASTFEFFASGAMTGEWLAALFVPFYHGGGYTGTPFREELLFWEYAGYVGVLTLAVSLAAAVAGWRRPHVLFFATLSVLGLVLSVGDKTPLYQFLYHVPVMNLFRFPSRYVFFVDLGTAVLAGLMIRQLAASLGGRMMLLLGTVPVAAVLWWIRTWWQPVSNWAWQIPVFALLAGMAATVVYWKHPQRLTVALTALMAIDSITFGTAMSSFAWRPVEKATAAPASVEFLLQQPVPFRAASFEFGLGLDRGARYGVEMINGYDSLVTKTYAEYADLGWAWGPLQRPRETLDLLNVKYVIVNRNDQRLREQPVLNGSSPMKQVWTDESTAILENPTAYPRYWLAPSRLEYKQQAGDPVQERMHGFSRYQVSYQSDTPRFLMISQMYYPGWKAYVDGQKAELQEVDGWLSGLQAPPGRHTVELRFEPAAWLWGRIVSLFSVLGLIAWGIIAKRRLLW